MKIFLPLLFLALVVSSCAVKPITATMPDHKVAPAKVVFTTGIAGATDYTWDFGDGTTAKGEKVEHTYYMGGAYNAKVTAMKGGKSVEQKILVTVAEPAQYLVELQTDLGNMTIELSKKTPKHTANFLKLADEGYYDGTLFHRVIWEFMIQGGDPNSRDAKPGQALGMGGPDYLIPAEFVPELCHTKGALAAARTNNPEKKSSGSQFYIVHGRPVPPSMLDQVEMGKGGKYTSEQREAYQKNGGTPHLDRDYTVFGQVIDGLGVVDQIAAVETAPGDRPKKDVKIRVRIKR